MFSRITVERGVLSFFIGHAKSSHKFGYRSLDTIVSAPIAGWDVYTLGHGGLLWDDNHMDHIHILDNTYLSLYLILVGSYIGHNH